MIYSQSKYTELFFFVPPKCGWTSFNKLHSEKHSKNAIEFYHQITNKLIVDVFIIRNPIDRFISAYNNKILNPSYVKDIVETKYSNTRLDTILNNLKEISRLDVHFYPLNKFYEVFDAKPKYVLDLNKDILKIEQFFGCKIPHENSTTNKNTLKLTKQQKKIICEVYKKDFYL